MLADNAAPCFFHNSPFCSISAEFLWWPDCGTDCGVREGISGDSEERSAGLPQTLDWPIPAWHPARRCVFGLGTTGPFCHVQPWRFCQCRALMMMMIMMITKNCRARIICPCYNSMLTHWAFQKHQQQQSYW